MSVPIRKLKTWTLMKWEILFEQEHPLWLRFLVATLVTASLVILFSIVPYSSNTALLMTCLTTCCLILVSATEGFWPGLCVGFIGFFAINYYYVVPVRVLPATVTDYLFLFAYWTLNLMMNTVTALLKRAYKKSCSSESEMKKNRDELQISEARLKEAQRIAHLGNWELDLRTNKLMWSDEIYRIFEICPVAFGASYEAFIKAIHPEDREKVNSAFTNSIKSKTPYVIDHRLLMADGRVKHVIESGQTFYDKNNNPLRSVGTVQDITERKLMEEELRKAVTTRDEFLSIASHELKTPLSALYLQLQLIGRLINKDNSTTSPQIAELGKKSVIACSQIIKLLNDLLDMTRIRTGKLELHKQAVNLSAEVKNTVALMSEEVTKSQCVIKVSAEESVIGIWDPSRINQIISNLLSNAIKYGQGKPIEVVVQLNKNEKSAILSIRDFGIGIPKDMQQKIFQRFERAVSGDKFIGLGLGLYIVKQIIEAHGGTIKVDSEPGQGALFVVELPLQNEEER
ncbi:MAG: hypothetical protein BroJett040_11240 [Oligoflexia bacterium]|nr:MAG: hypothetical protein BroJett040_11240 [Oligoflexia bacterium]